MRRLVPLLSLLSFACGGASPTPSQALVSGPEPAAAENVVERFDLRLRTSHRLASFSRAQSITIRDLGGHRVRVDAPSIVQLRRFPTGADPEGFLRYQSYGQLEFREDGVARQLPSPMLGLERHQIRVLVDRHSRVGEGPELTGSPSADPQLSAAVLALSRVVELVLPEQPVAVGEDWSEAPGLWRTPPLGLAVIEIDRHWTLIAVEGQGDEQTAHVAWHVELRLQPFELSGVSVAGRGRIEGISEVSLVDGMTGRAELDLTFEAGPAGALEGLSLFRMDAKIRDQVQPAVARGRGPLIQSARPTGSLSR